MCVNHINLKADKSRLCQNDLIVYLIIHHISGLHLLEIKIKLFANTRSKQLSISVSVVVFYS